MGRWPVGCSACGTCGENEKEQARERNTAMTMTILTFYAKEFLPQGEEVNHGAEKLADRQNTEEEQA